mmetsp:Transcript_3031/g.9198  ORF Transcript_3031/g.9198 Transcript_3031/m.9198 type:complete len:1130 (-) Transcript_3031:847-4236(-)
MARRGTPSPTPPTSQLYIAWAQDSQEEMLVCMAMPNNEAPSLWLSVDAGRSFEPIATGSSGVPANAYVSRVVYGRPFAGASYFGAYATVGRTLLGTPSPIVLLYSGDSGRTWRTYETASTTGIAVRVDLIDPHPTMPGLFLAHSMLNATTYRTYYGNLASVHVGSRITLVPIGLTESSPAVVRWARWSTASNTTDVFVIAQAAAAVAPNNGASLLRFSPAPSGFTAATVIIADIYDFTQVDNFLLAEVTAHNPVAGFNQTALRVSTDGGNTFVEAQLPVAPQSVAEYFEVVDASEGEIMVAAQHSAARLQGEVWIRVTTINPLSVNTLYLNASRAMFSDAIPSTQPSLPYNFVYDSTNQWGCTSSWAFPNQTSPFYLVVKRGNYLGGPICFFASKLQNAIDAGASGLIIVNNVPSSGVPHLYMVAPEGHDTSMYGSVPCVIVSRTEGAQLISALQTSGTSASGYIYESPLVAQRLYQYTSLYISSGMGTSFSRSLNNVRYVVNNGIEYVGVYVVASMATDPAHTTVSESGTYLANTAAGQTLVSTNKGASWAPVSTSSGQPLLVVLDTLSAQHGWSTPASVPTAPGLVVANAMPSSGTPTVFVSRDGGLSWTQANEPSSTTALSPQPYFFEILDHGSVIVLAETQARTSALYYSLDEGSSWNTFNFYGATTILGQWGTETYCNSTVSTAMWTCEPSWQPRSNMSSVAGFLMYCNAAGSSRIVIGVANSASGFSGSNDGITNTATVLSSTIASIPTGTVVYPNGDGVGTVTFSTSGSVTSCSSANGHSYTVKWARPADASSAHNIRFLATVSNMRASATQLFAYWYQGGSPGNAAVLGLRFDFAQVFPAAAAATQPSRPANGVCGTSDFEPFVLTGSGNNCYMGARAAVSRRRHCVVCRQSAPESAFVNISDWVSYSHCPCTSRDFSCAFGFRRVQSVQGLGSATVQEQCTWDSVISSAQGAVATRRVPGDMCTATPTLPITLSPTSTSPTASPTSTPPPVHLAMTSAPTQGTAEPTAAPSSAGPPGQRTTQAPVPVGNPQRNRGGSGGGGEGRGSATAAAVVIVLVVILVICGAVWAHHTGRCFKYKGMGYSRVGLSNTAFEMDDKPVASGSDLADDDSSDDEDLLDEA